MSSVITEAHFAIQSDKLCRGLMFNQNSTERLHTCDATIMRFFRQSNFHVSYRRRMPATLNWPRQSIGSGHQSSEMAALLNSLYFAFTNSSLPKYNVKYYDYIVKWCSGI